MPVDPSPIAAEVRLRTNGWRHAPGCPATMIGATEENESALCDCGLMALLGALETHGRVVLEGRSGQDARIRGLERGTILDEDHDDNCTAPGGTIVVDWGDGVQSGYSYANDHGLYRLTDPSPEEA